MPVASNTFYRPLVVQVTPAYEPSQGGVETHVRELNDELIKQGWRVKVLTVASSSQKSSSIIKTVINEDLVVVALAIPSHIKVSSLRYKFLIWAFVLKNIMAFHQAKKIQVHDVFWWVLPLFFTSFHKIYTTFHGWEGIEPVPFKNKVLRLIWAKLSRGTLHVGHWIQDFYWDKPTAVIEGAVRYEDWFQEVKPLPKSQKVEVAFLGRLEPENTIKEYISIVAELKKIFPPVVMTWVGGGSLKKSAEKVGRVTGMTDHPESFLHSPRIVFANSYLAIFEAMAAGKVVAALGLTPLKKAYLKSLSISPYILIGESIDDLVSHVSFLLKDKNQLLEWQNQSQQVARNKTWKKVMDQYLLVWGKNEKSS